MKSFRILDLVKSLRESIRSKRMSDVEFHHCVDQILRELLLSDFLQSEFVLRPDFVMPGNARQEKNLVNVGGVLVGGNQEIVVQSMAISSLRHLHNLVPEFKSLVDAGSQIVRIAVTGQEDAKNMRLLKQELVGTHYDGIPIVMCGQYNVLPIISETDILDHIAKLRINPGNITLNAKTDDNFIGTIKYLIEYNCRLRLECRRPPISIRVGVNWGSVDEKLKTRAMDINALLPDPLHYKCVEQIVLAMSAITSAFYAEFLGFDKNLIIVSTKTSTVADSYIVNKLLHVLCDYPIHLGITEAGGGSDGVILTACGLSPILMSGIGDTIRCSITPRIEESRTKEVEICKQVLQSMGLKSFKPRINSCPGCGRTDSNYFRLLTEKVDEFVQSRLEDWCSDYNAPGVKKLSVAVMGCLVNGPGESKHADIGISLPGYRESHSAVVYLDGKKHSVLKAEDSEIEKQFFQIIENYVANRYSMVCA